MVSLSLEACVVVESVENPVDLKFKTQKCKKTDLFEF